MGGLSKKAHPDPFSAQRLVKGEEDDLPPPQALQNVGVADFTVNEGLQTVSCSVPSHQVAEDTLSARNAGCFLQRRYRIAEKGLCAVMGCDDDQPLFCAQRPNKPLKGLLAQQFLRLLALYPPPEEDIRQMPHPINIGCAENRIGFARRAAQRVFQVEDGKPSVRAVNKIKAHSQDGKKAVPDSTGNQAENRGDKIKAYKRRDVDRLTLQ